MIDLHRMVETASASERFQSDCLASDRHQIVPHPGSHGASLK
jgi:hypothetical protein